MKIKEIDITEYFSILETHSIDIPIYADKEALDIYMEKEIIKIDKNKNTIALFVIPINNNGVRREYRYFPYLNVIFLQEKDNFGKKKILKSIFNYIFYKYDYCFFPLHPSFKMISAIQSEGGFVEMRHTHVIDKKLTLTNIPAKLRNHVKNAIKYSQIIIDYNYDDYDFHKAIRGNSIEQMKRAELAKRLIDNKKGIVVKAIVDEKIVAALICIYDKKWSYLLHSYQNGNIRGIIPLLILKASEFLFDKKEVKYFDFEGSVIDEIDDFFSGFNVNIVNYPYVINAKTKEKFYNLIERSINIEGRIKKYENK